MRRSRLPIAPAAGLLAAVFAAVLVAQISAAHAQGLDFADQKGTPVEIYADSGLELSQDAKTVIARGNARAVRGRVTVTADTLTAYYRDKAVTAPSSDAKPEAKSEAKAGATAPPGSDDELGGSKSEVWRVEADGHVVIFTDTQRAYGDHADYNIDDAVVVLTGKNLRLITAAETVTARDSLEYWERRQQAVARGKAVATRGDRRIQGDILVADYGQDPKDPKKGTVLRHATGFDNVVITAPNEVVTGNRADYDPFAGMVTVRGAVKMSRGPNQLNGAYAEVDLNTGISRVFPTAPGAPPEADAQVKGLLVPEHRQSATGTAAGLSGSAPLSKPSATP